MIISRKYLVTESDFDKSPYANKKYNVRDYIRSHSRIEQIIVHCTATDSQKWDDPEACINYDLQPNHISRKGCPTATYHLYVEQDGDISQLVSFYIKTMNCSGQNQDSIAICINHGGEKDDVVEKEQYDSLINAICYVFDFMDWSYSENSVDDRLKFHNQYSNKLCPGINLKRDNVVKDVIERLKTWGDEA